MTTQNKKVVNMSNKVISRFLSIIASPITSYIKTVKKSFYAIDVTKIFPSEYFDRDKFRATVDMVNDTEAQKPIYSFKIAMTREGLDKDTLMKGYSRLMFFNRFLFIFALLLGAYSLYNIGLNISHEQYSIAVITVMSLVFSLFLIMVMYLKYSWMAFRIRNEALIPFKEWLLIVKKRPNEIMPFINHDDKCDLIKR